MPTYAYECEKCGHTFERLQSMTDPPVTACPECRGEVRRLVSGGSGILFKGSGSHATDYGRAGGTAPAASLPAEGEGEAGRSEADRGGVRLSTGLHGAGGERYPPGDLRRLRDDPPLSC